MAAKKATLIRARLENTFEGKPEKTAHDHALHLFPSVHGFHDPQSYKEFVRKQGEVVELEEPIGIDEDSSDPLDLSRKAEVSN